MLKLLLAASMLLAPPPVEAQQGPDTPDIPKVVCRLDKGYKAGTAFRIGHELLVTAAHVVTDGQCQIGDKSITIFYKSPKADFAIISLAGDGRRLEIDCEGYQKGRTYLAIGHARALDDLVVVPMSYAGFKAYGLAALAGVFTAQPGQSGGPIIDAETGKVVGLVNTGDWERGLTGSVELKGTSICGGSDA